MDAPFKRLSSPLRITPWHVIQNERYTSVEAYPTITIRFQDLLTLCQEFFSAFPHGTILYRTRRIFKVRSCCLLASRLISKRRYSGYCHILLTFSYGTITLYDVSFQRTSDMLKRIKRQSYNTTSLLSFNSRFSLP